VRALVAVLAALAAGTTLSLGGSALARTGATATSDWPEFGYGPGRQNAGPASSGITATNVGRLRRRLIQLDGTVDSSPIYLHQVSAGGKVRDVVFVTTTYGRTEAIDVASAKVVWRYVPATYGSYAGSARITNMTPVADPDRTAIYAGGPDGRIVKLSVASGRLLWSTSITRDSSHEKLTSSLNFSRGMVIATTGGYIGDAPPYQGHVVTLNPANGHIEHVWNSLCSDRTGLIEPSTCGASDSAIWARSGAVVDPATGDLLVATGNGPWNGSTNWGDSMLVLSPDGSRLLKHWTPANQADLNANDIDVGSTAPAVLSGGYVVQGGKDGLLRLLSLSRFPGANAQTGGELQTVRTPGGTGLFSAPAVWKGKWVFVADGAGTQAWLLRGGRLHSVWSNGSSGTSPVLAGGLLYVEGQGAIRVYVPASGRELASLPIGDVHWQSPIVAGPRVVAAEGNANDHATNGVLDVYSLG
jgi:hypothetical protein